MGKSATIGVLWNIEELEGRCSYSGDSVNGRAECRLQGLGSAVGLESFPGHSHFCGYFLRREDRGLGEMTHWSNVLSVQA